LVLRLASLSTCESCYHHYPSLRPVLHLRRIFTTKLAGEAPGLGLSISREIIVKQQGGSIKVDTKPGEFVEIRIILPRATALLPNVRLSPKVDITRWPLLRRS